MKRFENRTILISAAADGLGLAIAQRLLAEAGTVIALDNNQQAIDRACSMTDSERLRFEVVDLMDSEALTAMLARLHNEGLRFDTLINNAGGSLHTPRPFLDETDDDWEKVMNLNLIAAVRLTRAVLPHMIEQGFGRIINLGSKAGRYGSLFTGANYVAAKGAVQSMTLQLAQEFGSAGITCNAVCPGAILTPRVERLLAERMSEAERQAALEQIPMRRHGKVDDVAAAVAYFASEEAGFVTGQMLDVNGGQGMCS